MVSKVLGGGINGFFWTILLPVPNAVVAQHDVYFTSLSYAGCLGAVWSTLPTLTQCIAPYEYLLI